jgi:hypothetical protein
MMHVRKKSLFEALVHLKLVEIIIIIKDRRNTEGCEAKRASKIVFNRQEVERRESERQMTFLQSNSNRCCYKGNELPRTVRHTRRKEGCARTHALPLEVDALS